MSLKKTGATSKGKTARKVTFDTVSYLNMPVDIKVKKPVNTFSKNTEIDDFMSVIFEMFKEIKIEQKTNLKSLDKAIEELLVQNAKLRESIELVSKNDKIKETLKQIELDRLENRKFLSVLKEKMDNFDQRYRCPVFKKRGISLKAKDTKRGLVRPDLETGEMLKLGVNRIVLQKMNIKPDKIQEETDFDLIMAKGDYIKAKNLLDNTKNKNCNVINEPNIHLSERNRYLFGLAQDFALMYKFDFCWISQGQVYLQKEEVSASILITSELDLHDLKQTI